MRRLRRLHHPPHDHPLQRQRVRRAHQPLQDLVHGGCSGHIGRAAAAGRLRPQRRPPPPPHGPSSAPPSYAARAAAAAASAPFSCSVSPALHPGGGGGSPSLFPPSPAEAAPRPQRRPLNTPPLTRKLSSTNRKPVCQPERALCTRQPATARPSPCWGADQWGVRTGRG
uniref:Uncharacterized protein n=1 Tax=Amazona collaria TaxID=241587 RepID=A0A8B9GE39_9PSIT